MLTKVWHAPQRGRLRMTVPPLEEEPPSTSTILSSLQEHLQKRARTSQAVQGWGPLEPFERLEEVLGPILLQVLQQVPG